MGKYYYQGFGKNLVTDPALWSAYRLGDFRGYKHNAVSPFPSYSFPRVVNKNNNTISLTKKSALTLYPGIIGSGGTVDTTQPGSLTLGEIQMPNGLRLDQAYLCLILQAKNGDLMYCTGTASGIKMNFEFKNGFPPEFTKNGATAYLAYVNSEIVWDGKTAAPGNLSWVRHPDMEAIPITFGDAAEAAGVDITIKQDERALPVLYRITISVEEGMPAVTCANNYIWFGSNGVEIYKYPDKISQSFLVDSKTPFTFSGQVIIANLNPKPSMMGVSLANGKYRRSMYFTQTINGTLVGAI
ncbi:MAG: hypothetical protein K2K69_06330 [Muribaculaceae bacterium]|nr:hypothetical protein [Muribaculaceae bacterium]